MSTDRELLELAAKAAGMKDAEYQYGGDWMETRHGFKEAMFSDALWEECGSGYWNPLADDGEALRLAVKLRIDLRFQQDGDMYVDAGDCDAYTVYLIDTNGDLAAATRRAIVRAAASLGRTL